MGKEREAQIRGTTLGMVALALLAAVTAVVIAFAVGGQLRSVFPTARARTARRRPWRRSSRAEGLGKSKVPG